MSTPNSLPSEGEEREFRLLQGKTFADEAAMTALKLSKDEKSPSALELMFHIQDELEKRLTVMSTQNPDFSAYQESLATVSLLIEEKVGPAIDKLNISPDPEY